MRNFGVLTCSYGTLPQRTGSLPEIFCLWASETHDFTDHSIKHLAGQVRWGNWASGKILADQCP